jgi:hypothetical protein
MFPIRPKDGRRSNKRDRTFQRALGNDYMKKVYVDCNAHSFVFFHTEI